MEKQAHLTMEYVLGTQLGEKNETPFTHPLSTMMELLRFPYSYQKFHVDPTLFLV